MRFCWVDYRYNPQLLHKAHKCLLIRWLRSRDGSSYCEVSGCFNGATLKLRWSDIIGVPRDVLWRITVGKELGEGRVTTLVSKL